MSIQEADIVSYVRDHPGVTPDQLADCLGVSTRTLRTYVKRANDSLAGTARIELRRGSGFALVVSDPEAFARWLDSDDLLLAGNVSHAERVSFLMSDLLARTDWVTLDELGRTLFSSRATLSNDLKEVKHRLEPFDLHIETRPRYGLRVVGPEMGRRLCLASSAVEALTGPSVRKGGAKELLDQRISLDVIARCVDEAMEASGFTINSMSYQNLLVHLAIAVMRIREGCYVPMASENLLGLYGTREFEAARSLAGQIGKAFDIELPQEEVAYIAIHLAGKQSVLYPAGEEEGLVISDEVWEVVGAMIDRVRTTYGFDFLDDLELRMNLARHVVPLLVRLRYNMHVNNPILQDIRARFPLAFSMATDATLVLTKRYGATLSENEVGFIALALELALERSKTGLRKKNIVVVCASGRGSARMLEYRYRQQFGDCVDKIFTCDVARVDKMDFSEIDYVFTTVPINRPLPVPVREVKFFLDPDDVADIRDLLNYGSRGDSYLRRFRPELFFSHLGFKTREEVIDFLCARMAETGEVSEGFRDLVWRREDAVATTFGNGVAMPHPIEPTSDIAFVAVGLLDAPVAWGDHEVRAVFLISISDETNEQLGGFYGALADLFTNPQSMGELVERQDWDTLCDLLRHRLPGQGDE